MRSSPKSLTLVSDMHVLRLIAAADASAVRKYLEERSQILSADDSCLKVRWDVDARISCKDCVGAGQQARIARASM